MATTFKYVTVDGAGDYTGNTDWTHAYGMAQFRDYLQSGVAADTIFYVQSGTYTMGEAITVGAAGALGTPIKIIGVAAGTSHTELNVVPSDYVFGTNRPLFAMEGNAFVTTAFNYLFNISFTGTTGHVVTVASSNCVYNCKCVNTTNSKYAFNVTGNYSILSNVEAQASTTGGVGIFLTGTINRIVNCYCHDSASGCSVVSGYHVIVNSIFDTCTSGIAGTNSNELVVIGNTVWGCTTGMALGYAYHCFFINNIISQCATIGVSLTSGAYNRSNMWKNNLFNNTTNWTTSGVDVETIDSSNIIVAVGTTVLTDAANGDFTLKTGDMTARSKALMLTSNEGIAAIALHQNIGVDQTGDFPAVAATLTSDTVDGVTGTATLMSMARTRRGH